MIEIDREELCRRIHDEVPDNLMAHAQAELEALGSCDEPMQKQMNSNLMELVLVFCTQGHSGLSGSYARQMLDKLLDFQPLCPLTGDDSEWGECSPGVFQNRRCSHVFKDISRFNGQAYDIQGKVFVDENGDGFTNSDSTVPITFPYTPVTERVQL